MNFGVDDLYIHESKSSYYPYTIVIEEYEGWRIGSGKTIKQAYNDIANNCGEVRTVKPPFIKTLE